MRAQLEVTCDLHPDPFDCPDSVVSYVAMFDEYGLIVHDGGASYLHIAHCPWCGSRLPESRRDEFFAHMDALGIDPWLDDLPQRFQTDAWFRGGETGADEG